jgi:hypothetical protein
MLKDLTSIETEVQLGMEREIIMRQVSPESIGIFEFLMELSSYFGGDWK